MRNGSIIAVLEIFTRRLQRLAPDLSPVIASIATGNSVQRRPDRTVADVAHVRIAKDESDGGDRGNGIPRGDIRGNFLTDADIRNSGNATSKKVIAEANGRSRTPRG
jgi:hypothetical protein